MGIERKQIKPEDGRMDNEALKEKVIEKIQEIYDPEIPVNIWDLGLIYEVNILPINNVQVVMTLTAPKLSRLHKPSRTMWIKRSAK